MSTHDLYTIPAEHATWDLEMKGASRFTWEYDDGRDRLLSLYQKGKDKQWDQTKRIDWSLEVDPHNALGLPVEAISIYGTDQWKKIENDQGAIDELSMHLTSWQFSQFLHGDQGEARHAETYARFLQEKIGMLYPINPYLKSLLDDTLTDSRWDMPYLGMQVLIEGLALAAFGVLRDMTTVALPKQILAYVMQDEARHVAFGRMALKDYYSQLTSKERGEREDFVVEGCYMMRDRFRMQEVWQNLGFDVKECLQAVEHSPFYQAYQSMLFTRIVPCVKDIGLWGEKVQKAYADMGVLDMAGVNLEDLMKSDEDIADTVDTERLIALEAREVASSKLAVDETIAVALAD